MSTRISGSVGNMGNIFSFYILYSYSQDINNNCTTISATAYIATNNTSYDFSSSDAPGSVTIGGNSASRSGSFSTQTHWPSGTPVALCSRTVTLYHDASGYLSPFTISAAFDCYAGGWGPSKCSASASVSVPTIPRASHISSSASFTVGSNLDVSINRASSSFVHDVKLYAWVNGSWVQIGNTLSKVGTGGTISLSVSDVAYLYSNCGAGVVSVCLDCWTYRSSSDYTAVGTYTSADGSLTLSYTTSLSASTYNIRAGDGITVYASRNNGAFTHNITATLNGYTKTLASQSTDNSFGWSTGNDITSILNSMPTAYETMTITLQTLYGGTQIGSTAITISINCVDRIPSFSTWTYTCDHTDLTGSNQILILRAGTISVTISVANKATVATGASLSRYQISDGTSIANMTIAGDGSATGSLTKPNSNTITVTAVDSRGLRKDVTVTVSAKDYNPPYLTSGSALRQNQVDTHVNLSLTGYVWHNSFGSVTNACTITAYRKLTTEPDSSYVATSVPTTATYSGNTFSLASLINGDLGSTGFTASLSFNIKIVMSDTLSSTISYLVLSRGIPSLHMTKNGIGIGKLYGSGALDVHGDINTDDTIQANNVVSNYMTVNHGFTCEDIGSIENFYATNSDFTEKVQMRKGIYTNHFVTANSDGTGGYMCVARIEVTGPWSNAPLTFVVLKRARARPLEVSLCFNNVSDTNVSIVAYTYTGDTDGGLFPLYHPDGSNIWEIYVHKDDPWDVITVIDKNSRYGSFNITYPNTFRSGFTAIAWATPTPVDYIVAQGRSGSETWVPWRYTKWASGRAECWAYYTWGTVDLLLQKAGSVYSNDSFKSVCFNFIPGFFKDTVYCDASIQSTGYSDCQVNDYNLTGMWVRAWSPYSTSVNNFRIAVHALGSWI